jgi:hypothetical protein
MLRKGSRECNDPQRPPPEKEAEMANRGDESMEAIDRARRLLADLALALEQGALREGQFSEARREELRLVGDALALLLEAPDIKCTLDGKEPVPIHTRPEGPDGRMVMRCEHEPSHCWNLDGVRVECPA